MQRPMRSLVIAAAVGLALFLAGRFSRAPGIDAEDAAELARHAGDSAVLSYRKSVEEVVPELRDSIRYYKGKAEAGVRIVVRRVPVLVRDTTRDTTAAAPVDTAEMALPVVVQDGVTATETLTVAPRPAYLARSLALAFDSDTILAALLRTPEGLQRFTAAGTRAGLQVHVADAAGVQPKQGRGLVRTSVTVLTLASCVVAGRELGQDRGGTVLLVSGSTCLGTGLGRLLGWPR